MNINNNSPVSFGVRINKELETKLKQEVEQCYNKKSYNKSNVKEIEKDYQRKKSIVSQWGDDSFELVETRDRVRDIRTIGIRKIDNKKPVYSFRTTKGRLLLTKFFAIQKDEIINGIQNLKHELTIEEIQKHFVKLR